jgi:hypothetical protein
MDLSKVIAVDFSRYEEKSNDFHKWLSELRTKDDEYFEIFTAIFPISLAYLKKTPNKLTLSSLFTFAGHLNLLKNGLIELCDSDNLYSAKALYRVYLEHWLRAIYIWTRYTSEHTDQVGNEYHTLGGVAEDLRFGKTVNDVSRILEAEDHKIDVWERLSEIRPEIKALDKHAVEVAMRNFEYKRIVKYLVDNEAPGSDWALAIVSEYSELSSFVHGGSSAKMQLHGLTSVDKQFDEYRGMLRFAYNMCRVYAFQVFALMLKDPILDEEQRLKLKELLPKLKEDYWV